MNDMHSYNLLQIKIAQILLENDLSFFLQRKPYLPHLTIDRQPQLRKLTKFKNFKEYLG